MFTFYGAVENKEDKSLPTKQYLQITKLLSDQCYGYLKSVSPDLRDDFLRLKKITQQLADAVEIEESGKEGEGASPEFAIDNRIFEERRELKQKVLEDKKRYEVDFVNHEKELAKIESCLEFMHNKIIEEQNQTILGELKSMVSSNKLHGEIDDAILSLHADIDAQDCCTSMFLFCRPSKKVKEAQLRIEQLQDEKKSLDSSDPVEVRKAAVTVLDRKRDKIQLLKEKLLEMPPEKIDEKYSDEVGKIDARIARNNTRHNLSLNDKTLFQMLRAHEVCNVIMRKLKKSLSDDKKTSAKTPLIDPIQKLYDVFMANNEMAKKLFSAFWRRSTGEDVSFVYGSLKESEKAQLMVMDEPVRLRAVV